MSTNSQNRAPEALVSDPASVEMLHKARAEQVPTVFERYETQRSQCAFGRQGVCCRVCHMGPCRISAKAPRGICGADADTIVARNFLREVAAGSAAHADHCRHLVLLLKKTAQGEETDYSIKDIDALRNQARMYGLPGADEREPADLARDLAACFLAEFTDQESPLRTTLLAPLKRQAVWRNADATPGGIDRMIVEALHRGHIGVDHDYRNILLHAFRTSLADGWGGSRIASMASDVLFGTPMPVRSQANLGVLQAANVNILVHGHEPALSELLAAAVRDKKLLERARGVGAAGITLAGICCTANEVLMRHGIPVAGNFLQQELALITGAVELMVTDVQCVMPSLPTVAANYHTEVVSTSDIARTVGATHLPFEHHRAMDCARELVRRAVDNFSRRDPAKVSIPTHTRPLVAGFSLEAVKRLLGGRFRASLRPLNDAVIAGRIKGVAGIVGCNNPKTKLDAYINAVTRELVANDVLVLKTGCAALASAKAGMLAPEAALEYAGPGLREVCQATGLPPVLHLGSCVDNSRILEAAAAMLAEGGLGEDFSDLPAVGLAPEWMSEKAVAIGCYFVASGLEVILGQPFHVGGSPAVEAFLGDGAREMFGAGFRVCEDPALAAREALEIIALKRERLGIDRQVRRKLFDMKDRRTLDVRN